nr:isoform 2 of 26s protease regulatory subunit 6a like [Quercus suber]
MATAMAEDSSFEDDQLAAMSTDDVVRASRLLDTEIRILKDELQRTNLDLDSYKEKIKENQEKIKLNKQLPYLVGNIVEVIAATNRADILDPALMRSGRLDRKIEFPHPSEEARARILQIHSRKMNVHPDVNFEELARSTDDFNGAQLKAVCVEAGMLALRRDATEVNHEDFNEGIIQVQAKKKSSLNYYA